MDDIKQRRASVKGKKTGLSRNKELCNLNSWMHSLENWYTSLENLYTRKLETSLLMNCGKFLVCHPENGRVLTQKVASE